MGHTYAMRLHGVTRDIGIVAHIRVVEVGDFLLAVAGTNTIGEWLGSHGACHFGNSSVEYGEEAWGVDQEEVEEWKEVCGLGESMGSRRLVARLIYNHQGTKYHRKKANQ